MFIYAIYDIFNRASVKGIRVVSTRLNMPLQVLHMVVDISLFFEIFLVLLMLRFN